MEKNITFQELNISPKTLRAIEDMGFEEPTPIQTSTIPAILDGRDVTGQAQTGTGKTAAFGVPAIERVDPDSRKTQVLVLSPTRELAIQTAEEFSHLAKHHRGINILPIYGGQPIDRQFRALERGVQIVVGTPGRVLDHLDRGTLSFGAVKLVVLDEADQMLDMGFREDIEKILDETPRDRQTILFSATLPRPILEISKKFQKNPEFISVARREVTVPQIEQLYLEVRNRDKLEVLTRLLDMYDPDLTLIFSNTKRGVDDLTTHLQARGHFAEGLHGDMKQTLRDRVMAKFRGGSIDVLVATDVAARGIDVEDVDLVINYDVPQDIDYYIHRIGRTARAGRAGRAVTFVGQKEYFKLRTIQNYTKINIARIPLPTQGDVEESRTRKLIERVQQTIEAGDLDKYVNLIERIITEDYTSLEVAAALLKLEIGGTAQGQPQDIRPTRGQALLRIPVGREHQIRPKDIVGALAGETGISGSAIGAINIYDTYSTVDVPIEAAEQIIEGMKGKTIARARLTRPIEIVEAAGGR
ncbi:DEAD/DEAH box helicase [Methanoculleus horonobensis]|jgi:ATP-dependent RNA helicase DeaD|uniref:DEAD/DEAH box helicase n=1 Tax=Methanoculleus horonobensis TaxID=528314 RepID=UPI00083501BE|nr:DEAD/DEAH box helicase [Methanoculleus horonobensis]MDD3071067.1 DEAD/DEAH box helicase [Methanoculleus horonobensis]MDD4252084.1 DEAD/DEAH box helicase [Methanoculleus horonobensis]